MYQTLWYIGTIELKLIKAHKSNLVIEQTLACKYYAEKQTFLQENTLFYIEKI